MVPSCSRSFCRNMGFLMSPARIRKNLPCLRYAPSGVAVGVLAIAAAGQACATGGMKTSAASLQRPGCEAASRDARRGFEGATLADALQGKVPGLNIVQVGGAAGAGFASIRGINSLRSGQPLVYLDGIRISQITATGLGGAHTIPLFEYVNVADIDRIEVLRGPAATIEYGSDAADGVIRIYTRRGGGYGVPADSTSQCKTTGDSAISPVR